MAAVLFIEDDIKYQTALQRALKGWDFLFETSGDEGLNRALLYLDRLDAIILDIRLKQMNGWEVYNEIRRHHDTIPMIIYSSDNDALQQLATRPWTWTARKPLPTRDLVTLIQQAVNEYAVIRPPVTPVPTGTPVLHRVVDTVDPDAQPVHPIHNVLDAVDLSLVHQHLQTAIERGRITEVIDPVAYLQKRRCMVDSVGIFVPTRAGVLVFSATPDHWIAASGIDIVQYKGKQTNPENILFQNQVRGSIFEQIDRTVDLLWARTEHQYYIEGTERKEYHAYALQVLRELTTNAVVHRDWQVKGRTRIQVFPNCIEWISPGSLPEGARSDALREAQIQRNPWIAQLLYDAGRVEAFGMGIDTVEDTLQAWGCPPPEVEDGAYAFTIRVFAKPLPRLTPAPLPVQGDRKTQIIATIRTFGSITRKELQALFPNVTERTLQRDLRELVVQGKIAEAGSTNDRRYLWREAPDQE